MFIDKMSDGKFDGKCLCKSDNIGIRFDDDVKSNSRWQNTPRCFDCGQRYLFHYFTKEKMINFLPDEVFTIAEYNNK